MLYVCHSGHENDHIYSENILEYFLRIGIPCRTLQLRADGQRPELLECLNDWAIGVLGFNSHLDHSWLGSESFLDVAARQNLPVIQWFMDHPSSRWWEFNVSTSVNSRFLFNSARSEQYFRRFCLPGARTGVTGGIGSNARSRIAATSQSSFTKRPIKCLVPMNLSRLGETPEQTAARISALGEVLAKTVNEGIAQGETDLSEPLEHYLVEALMENHRGISSETFNLCFQLAEKIDPSLSSPADIHDCT